VLLSSSSVLAPDAETHPIAKSHLNVERALPGRPCTDALLDWWELHDGSPVEITGAVEEQTGRSARTFAAWAEDHRADFTS
jgi:hypothetical protein